MHRLLISSILYSSSLIASEINEQADALINKPNTNLPALELLPTGSILRNLNIPRYNPDYTPASLLTADKITVKNDNEVSGENVSICLYSQVGKKQSQTTLKTVIFNHSTGLITSRENLTFSGDIFTATSQGIALDWQNHCGFLLGKNQTIIYLKKATPMNNSTHNLTPKPKKLSTVAASVIAVSTPGFLSAQDLEEVDQQSQSSTEQFITQLDKTKEALEAKAKAEAEIAAITKELNEKLGDTPKIEEAQPIPAELKPVKGKDFINVKSDRLMFDAKKGVFVYSGGIHITHPKYNFTCDGELKVILNQAADVKKLNADENAKLKANDRFDDVRQVIATKNVIVKSKDNKGRPVSAVTQNLSFNKATGIIILKGKGSRITTADGQLKVISQNGYIQLDEDMNASGQGTSSAFSVPQN